MEQLPLRDHYRLEGRSSQQKKKKTPPKTTKQSKKKKKKKTTNPKKTKQPKKANYLPCPLTNEQKSRGGYLRQVITWGDEKKRGVLADLQGVSEGFTQTLQHSARDRNRKTTHGGGETRTVETAFTG